MGTPRDELHALVDSLSDTAAAELLPQFLLLRSRWESRSTKAVAGSWPPAWFGSAAGSSPDVASRSKEILREEFGRRP